MSDEHKRALANGRKERQAVRKYLEALESQRPKRGRKRSTASIKTRLDEIEKRLGSADALTKVHLVQERINLDAEVAAREAAVDLSRLEEGFVKSGGSYAKKKGISYLAWRQAGVEPGVLKRAGIPRSKLLGS